jgi:uncharacterized protein YyaL (SSP411 family)
MNREKEMMERQRYSEKYNWLYVEKSPYLQQHSLDAIHWYPWGPAAFARAKREEKPVFLSIGYS